jgi:gamma-glutamyltranspeptidase/glutathione hydrolase
MSPTLVLKDGKVVLAVGASGGPTIITSTLQVLLSVMVFGMDPQAAVDAGRIHHQWKPETLAVEPEFPADVVERLQSLGHSVTRDPRFSAVQVIQVTPGGLRGASDPSKQGHPAGF